MKLLNDNIEMYDTFKYIGVTFSMPIGEIWVYKTKLLKGKYYTMSVRSNVVKLQNSQRKIIIFETKMLLIVYIYSCKRDRLF